MRSGTCHTAAAIGAVALSALTAGAECVPPEKKVYIVVIDGLEPEDVSLALTPNLQGMIDTGEARKYTGAAAIMVTETNANHVAMVTGAYGDTSGIVANSYLRVTPPPAVAVNLEEPALNLAETLFDRIETERPCAVTAAVMGKSKLRKLFDCTPSDSDPASCGTSTNNPEGIAVTHLRPDHLIGATEDPDVHEVLAGRDAPGEPASGSGYTLDNLTMELAIRLEQEEDPHFVFVNLGGVDGLQHVFGAKSAASRAAVANADALVGRLVGTLRDLDRWDDTVLFVTADHSFHSTGDSVPAGETSIAVANQATPQVTGTAIVLGDLFAGKCTSPTSQASFAFRSHSGTASVYITDTGYNPYLAVALTGAQERCLKELREAALAYSDRLGNAGVADALYRRPNVEDPDTAEVKKALDSARPEWHLAGSARIGDLVLTTKDTHWFIDSRSSSRAVIPGHHGGPAARPIPFVVGSGSEAFAAGTDSTATGPVDIAPTAACLLGVDPPADNEGQLLTAICSLNP